MAKTKTNKVDDVVEATPVENVATNEVAPEPSTVDYGATIKLLPKFKNDVVNALSNYAYVETHQLIKVIEGNDELPINVVNEIISRISAFPYSGVKNVMNIIETAQNEYFEMVNREE